MRDYAAAPGRPQQGTAPSGGSAVRETTSVGFNILVVKLSSLGDVVHAMPAVQDMRCALPGAQIDWAVEPGFAPLVRRCEGVRWVIECNLRHWRKAPLAATTRQAWGAFKAELQATAYDAVIDLQGLTKSALVSRLARLSATGKRFALANRTDDSSYEAPTRWVADVAVAVTPHSPAVQRARELCAKALGYGWPLAPSNFERYGLQAFLNKGYEATNSVATSAENEEMARPGQVVALVHGTSRADKLWPERDWIALGECLLQTGKGIALLHGNAEELARSQRIAQALTSIARNRPLVPRSAQPVVQPSVQVWPRLSLDALTDALAQTAGVIGVDSGLSHIAVALDLPHVQLYNFDTAWRTGPAEGAARQRSVYATPHPTLAQVWGTWQAVTQG